MTGEPLAQEEQPAPSAGGGTTTPNWLQRLPIIRGIVDGKRAEEALRETREDLETRTERQLLRRNPYGLTFREHTVLHLVAAGESDRQIGTTLGISPLTAQKHMSNILAKMAASSRTEASVRAVREGLIE